MIVKVCQLLATDSASHDRHVVDRGPFDHRVDGGPGALGFELASLVLTFGITVTYFVRLREPGV